MQGNALLRLDGLKSAIAAKRGARLVGTYAWNRDESVLVERWRRRLPDAIVCSSDLVAAHVLKLLAGIGRRCPEDALVTGVNDVDLATLVSPSLTTIHQPCKAIAQTALETLLWRIENPEATTRRIFLAADLVERESTAR